MKKIIILTSSILIAASIAIAQPQVRAVTKMTELKISCNKDQTKVASAACDQLGDVYFQGKFNAQKNTTLALYYWRKSLETRYDLKDDKGKATKKTENKISRLFNITALDLSRQKQMCLCIQMLPYAINSDVFSKKTNTIDQNIEAQIGNYKSILSNSNIGLGVQVDYSLQTFINSIGSIYNHGNIAHAITWLYLLGQAMQPGDPMQGMVTELNDAAKWTFSRDLFNNRNAMAQYGAALQVIDLIQHNKIKNQLFKKIIAKLMTGDPGAAATLLLSDKSTMIAAVNVYKKIRIDKCGLPAELL